MFDIFLQKSITYVDLCHIVCYMEEKKRITAMLTYAEAAYVKKFIHLLRERPEIIEYFRLQDFPFKPLLEDFSCQKRKGILERKKAEIDDFYNKFY